VEDRPRCRQFFEPHVKRFPTARSPVLVLLAALLFLSRADGQDRASFPIGSAALYRFDQLPLLRRGVWFHSSTSISATGENLGDGFTGAFSSQYVSNGRYVFLDTLGPACLTLFWASRYNVFTDTTSFDGDLTVEMQKNGKPDRYVLPFRELFSETRTPFLPPLVREEGKGLGSSWSLVPICSENGLRISTDQGGSYLFYEIYYHQYAPGTTLEAFSPDMDLSAARQRWQQVGEPLDPRPANTNVYTVDLPALSRTPVWSSAAAGTVTGVQIGLPAKYGNALREVRIRAWWDDAAEPAVDSPIGPFFGTGYWPIPDAAGAAPRHGHISSQPEEVKLLGAGEVQLGRVETRSLPVGAGLDGFYNYFPMPYARSARIELVNTASTPLDGVQVTIHQVDEAPASDSAYFHAAWRQENPVLPHRDFTVLETRGHGHYVGAVLVISTVYYDPDKRQEVQRWQLEGDARFYIDDNRSLASASTGTEDYYMGGWYDVWSRDKTLSLPVNGYPVHDIDLQDHSVLYRFHLSDLVPYYRSFRFTLEHGPDGGVPANYSGTAFYYQVDTPALVLSDQLTLVDAQSEQAHAYRGQTAVWEGCRDLPFEGDRQSAFTLQLQSDASNHTLQRLIETRHACGRRNKGAIEFTAAILPENRGIKLRRMMDYSSPDLPGQESERRSAPIIAPGETAAVMIDGENAGVWYQPPRHARLAWLEDDFEIPAQFTAGKNQVRIRLQVAPESAWSAFQYRVYSYR